MITSVKLIFSGFAIIVTFFAFVPYIRSILSGDTKPHLFSWLIWSITTIIVFFAQLEANGGIGTWPIGISGAITGFIAFLAFIKRTDNTIKTVDWVFLLAALASLPVWYYTSNPLWAVVILTAVDLLGFGPTIRKAYTYPHEESILFFMLFTVRNTLAILALDHYSTATVLFPLSVAIACTMLSIMIWYQRRI